MLICLIPHTQRNGVSETERDAAYMHTCITRVHASIITINIFSVPTQALAFEVEWQLSPERVSV